MISHIPTSGENKQTKLRSQRDKIVWFFSLLRRKIGSLELVIKEDTLQN